MTQSENRAPLKKQRVILLRSIEQSHELKHDLEQLGADVLIYPMIEIIPQKEILNKISEPFLKSFTTIIFTSSNGVNIFFEHLKNAGIDPKVFDAKIFAIGPKTAETLRNWNIFPDAMPDKFVAEKVLDLFSDHLEKEQVLIPTSQDARKVLPEELSKRNASVTVLPIYRNITPELPEEAKLFEGDFVVFTSSSTVEHFFQTPLYQNQSIIAFCIGEITKNSAERYLKNNLFVSEESTAKSLVQRILDYVNSSTI